ncbi:MAG: hypothetical protein CMJ20_00300 [Phycisphaeraceae bacterium]|nr:hypothetical protein [Phycisphaeraceae bacterium]
MDIKGIVALEDREKIMAGPGLPVAESDPAKDQWDARVLRCLRQAMVAQDLDALFVIRAENVCWLTHWWDHGQMTLMPAEENAWVIVPRDGEPFGLGTGAVSWGMEMPTRPHWLQNMYAFNMASFDGEAQPACELLKHKGLGNGRIGIETEWMPYKYVCLIQEQLPEVEFVSSDAIFYQLRSEKSPFEIEVIKAGVNVFNESLETAIEHLSRNKDIERAMRVLSTEMAARNGRAAIIPTCQQYGFSWLGKDSQDSRVARDWFKAKTYDPETELFCGDFCMTYEGYWVDLSLYEWINPDKAQPHRTQIKEQQARLTEMQLLMNRAIKPGMTGVEAEQEIEAAQAASGIDFHYWFHGIGLNIHEQPIIGRGETARSDVRYEVGAVACTEVFSEGILYEDMVMLGEGGWEYLTTRRPFIRGDDTT